MDEAMNRKGHSFLCSDCGEHGVCIGVYGSPCDDGRLKHSCGYCLTGLARLVVPGAGPSRGGRTEEWLDERQWVAHQAAKGRIGQDPWTVLTETGRAMAIAGAVLAALDAWTIAPESVEEAGP